MLFNSRTSLLSLVSALTLLIPSTVAQAVEPDTVFGLNGLAQTAPGRICSFPNGDFVTSQGDGNIVVYTNDFGALWSVLNDGGKLIPGAPEIGCPAQGSCEFVFQGDGNFVSYWDGEPLWNSQTEGRGEFLICQQVAPWLYIIDAGGNVIWSTSST